MYLKDLMRSCLRRWPLVIVCVLISGAAVFGASTVIKPTYASTARVVLVPPPNPEIPDQNRYLGLGGLKQTADVVASSMMSETTAKMLGDKVPGATYRVEPDWSTSAPILVITASGPTSAGAGEMMDAALAELPVTLDQLQESVDIKQAARITELSVSNDVAPKAVTKTQIRLLGMLTVVLLVVSALVVGAVDGLLLRRAGRREPGDLVDIEKEKARRASKSFADEPRSKPADPAPKPGPPPPRTAPGRTPRKPGSGKGRPAPTPDGSERPERRPRASGSGR